VSKPCEHVARALIGLAEIEQMRYGQLAAKNHDNAAIVEAAHKEQAIADLIRKMRDQWNDA